MAALKKEFERLIKIGCWGEKKRRSKQECIQEAKASGRQVQLSLVYGIIGKNGPSSQMETPGKVHRESGVAWRQSLQPGL
jgi:hypothetical protein